MEQKSLARWLKVIILGIGICGIIFYICVLPMIANDMIAMDTQRFSGWYLPWYIFLGISIIPCYVALTLGWRIAGSIGADCSFTEKNAWRLKVISVLAMADCGYLFVGNIVLLFLDMNHPGVLLAFCFILFVGVTIAVAAAALSHLVKKAAALQEQSDLTI